MSFFDRGRPRDVPCARRAAPRSRSVVGLLVVVIGLVSFPVGLAGCAASPPAADGPSAHPGAASRLLRELIMPPGAAPLQPGAGLPTGFQSDEIDCPGMLERDAYWRVPTLSIRAAQAWFQQHAPSGMRVADGGSGGDRTGETMTDVDYAVTAGQVLPEGSRLVVESVPDGAGSVVRASAQVLGPNGCGSVPRFPVLHG